MGEGSEDAQAEGPREASTATIEELIGGIEERVPGFAGMFVDAEQDVLYVYSVERSDEARMAAEEALADVLGDRAPVRRIKVLPARYAFPSLETSQDRRGQEGESARPRTVVEGRRPEPQPLAGVL